MKLILSVCSWPIIKIIGIQEANFYEKVVTSKQLSRHIVMSDAVMQNK